ncbi:hypothetical protein KUC_3111 [Vreelandella boliviensis LC1]|uniref:Uncharacterized protein n=1 Tax=Vreelandella boliviensis LC1 TaxID=1072583 RepID=A0A7U9GG53_9GAMM|nr:hypothetical protein KUC_3111 [Halomonas boliviensis LC1]
MHDDQRAFFADPFATLVATLFTTHYPVVFSGRTGAWLCLLSRSAEDD